ncbi:MAG: DUF1353 domain-containing protein [Hyphomicrobiaceae bacterium]
MSVKELARAVAGELGPDVASETDAALAGIAPVDGPRVFSTDVAIAMAGFVVAAAQHAVQLWEQQQSREALLTAIAEGVERVPELAGRLHPERRLDILGRVVDHLVPEQSSRSLLNDPAKERRKWLEQWLAVDARALSGPPILQAFADMDYFALFQPIYWRRPHFSRPDLPYRVSVPKGFVTDLASVPRIFWQALPPQGRYGPAAILHDWLYWQQATTREIADNVFLVVMEELDVSASIRRSMWAAVRVFGGPFWEQNSRERRAGGRRVLRSFPSDTKTTWKSWCQRPDVFEQDSVRRLA